MKEILQKFPDCWEMANSKGRTILHIAAGVERDVATNFILKKPWVSSLINRKDNEGNTPLHVLASKGKAGLHMYPGADMLALNNETMTPLDILNREVPDAVSEHRTVRESIEDDTSPMESSHRPPTRSPGPDEQVIDQERDG
ncbi:ankyrin repeat-containing protein At5g02620-like isoform X2 [Rhododendron vialii]|uniref:ankyrin repeat-containing protein At5g02620-like isoform X2 n=1 Tax=Rhododendron vialii TaxID=182163 RepID=UPI00265F01F3|nr:ankyrin repeat-containing protein At5g02620-like isoform X2 [Rhododendron vialii]